MLIFATAIIIDRKDMKKLAFCILLATLSVTVYSQTRQERLTEHVYYFAADSLQGRQAGTIYANKAAAYIVDEFEAMGLKPFYDDWYLPFVAPGTDNYKDVVGVLEGNDPVLKNEYIVVGAHYDHLGVKNDKVYNGADDNASGTAAVIEIARALLAHKDELKRTVVIAAFDAEEMGLYGSNALAERMIGQDSLDVRFMMSVDMVGWYRATNSLTLEGVATIKDGRKVLQSEKINLKLKNFEWSPVTATDTEGFAKRQVPTLAVSTGLKSPYHKPEDDADLIDYEGLDKVTDYLTDLTLEVASDEDFASSGRVARKHSGKNPVFEAGLSAGIGSSWLEFPNAAFDGKNGFTYGAGLSTQLNFGMARRFGIKAEAIYMRKSLFFPDEAALYESSLKYKGDELMVPVELIYQGSGRGTAYLGIGGYYDRRLKTSLATSQVVRPVDYGLSYEFGLKIGGIGMSWIFMSSLTPFFKEEGAPHALQGTCVWRLHKFF